MIKKFLKKYLSRTFRNIERHHLVEHGDNIFVALSGGKDSAASLFVLKKFIQEKKIEAQITGFHINFGLPVSGRVEEIVREQTRMAEVKLKVINLSELGISMEKIAKRSRRKICSICGVIKRYLINKFPREEGANKVATGHHMDDFIVFFIKNLAGHNFGWISKFKPMLEPNHPKMVGKMRPLFYVGGKENRLFCEIEKIPYVEEEICPHSALGCGIDKKGKAILDSIYYIEKHYKDFRLRMVRAIEELSKKFEIEEEIKTCAKCGEPTSGEICSFCKLVRPSM